MVKRHKLQPEKHYLKTNQILTEVHKITMDRKQRTEH